MRLCLNHLPLLSLILYLLNYLHFLIVSNVLGTSIKSSFIKKTLSASFLPAYLEDWVDNGSSKFIYILLQVSMYPSSHLWCIGWYLDFSVKFARAAVEACSAAIAIGVGSPFVAPSLPAALRLLLLKAWATCPMSPCVRGRQ